MVATHVATSYPPWWDAYNGRFSGPFMRAVTWSPLHLVWDGTAAVVVFFVLSGTVLPFAVRRASSRWRPYYTARLLRIYLPVWGAVLLGALTIVVLLRHATLPSDSVLTASRPTLSVKTVLEDSTLLAKAGGVVAPLWSLQWEMWFSLLLPVYLWVAVRTARWPVPTFLAVLLPALVLALVPISIVQQAWYLLPFAAGVLLHQHWDAIADRARSWSTGGWSVLVAASVAGLTAPWTLKNISTTSTLLVGAGDASMIVGATLAVVIAGHGRTARRALSSGLSVWLGRRSFSLYLVHYPVIAAVYVGLSGTLAAVPLALAMGVLSLVAAEAFYRAVERPALMASRRASSTLAARVVAPVS